MQRVKKFEITTMKKSILFITALIVANTSFAGLFDDLKADLKAEVKTMKDDAKAEAKSMKDDAMTDAKSKAKDTAADAKSKAMNKAGEMAPASLK